MSDKLDAILQSMAELTETVREHENDRATVDDEKLLETFQAQIDAKVEAQVEEKMAAQPVSNAARLSSFSTTSLLTRRDVMNAAPAAMTASAKHHCIASRLLTSSRNPTASSFSGVSHERTPNHSKVHAYQAPPARRTT